MAPSAQPLLVSPLPSPAFALPSWARTLRICYLVIGVAGAAAYAVLAVLDVQPIAVREALSDVMLVLGASACLLRGALVRTGRAAWLALGGGALAWAVGDVYYQVVLVPAGEIPYPSLSDFLYLGFYLACFTATLALARVHRLGPRASSLDALIGVFAIAMLWAAVLPADVFGLGAPAAELVVNLAYPLFDISLLAVATLVVVKSRWRPGPAIWFLAVSLSVLVFADTLYLVQAAQDIYVEAGLTDLLWPASVLGLGLAAWTSVRPPTTSRSARFDYVLPAASSVLALAVVIWDHFGQASLLTLSLAMATILAATVRGAELYRERDSAAGESAQMLRRTARALALAVDGRDGYTAYHSQRVTLYALAIAIDLGLPEDELDRLTTAGLLHDVGKISVPDAVLLKPDRLTYDEFGVMKGHAAAGAQIVAATGMQDIAKIVRHHHERSDGRGYPDGLTAENTPYLSRILVVADSLDAMTTDRAYRDCLSTEQAKAELEGNAGTQFDPAIARTAVSLIERSIIRPGQAVPLTIDALVAGHAQASWIEQVHASVAGEEASDYTQAVLATPPRPAFEAGDDEDQGNADAESGSGSASSAGASRPPVYSS